MDLKVRLEQQIEDLRKKMYSIYKNNPTEEDLVLISQELDDLLNKFNAYTNGHAERSDREG